jgi:hypothetical protein
LLEARRAVTDAPVDGDGPGAAATLVMEIDLHRLG